MSEEWTVPPPLVDPDETVEDLAKAAPFIGVYCGNSLTYTSTHFWSIDSAFSKAAGPPTKQLWGDSCWSWIWTRSPQITLSRESDDDRNGYESTYEDNGDDE